MFTLSVPHTSASSVQYPLFLLCVCFEIVPSNPFRVVILFYALLSAKLLIDIHLFSIYATHFFWSGWKRIMPTPKFWSSVVSFLHMLCVHRSMGQGLKLIQWKLWLIEIVKYCRFILIWTGDKAKERRDGVTVWRSHRTHPDGSIDAREGALHVLWRCLFKVNWNSQF